MKCGGKMSKGGKVTTPVKKMKSGGITQDIVGMPGYNANIRPKQMRNGGAKYNNGGPTVPATTPTVTPASITTSPSGQQRVMTKSQNPSSFNQPVGNATFSKNGGAKSSYKKGGSVRKAKLAAMAAPKNKITRADIITAAKRNAKKK
jgi:hypothetical protein